MTGAVRPILIWPDSRLQQRAAPVGEVDAEVGALWDDMLATMYAMPGVGLAAPQIGVGRRLAVVDAGGGPIRIADPILVSASAETASEDEGSPCLPGMAAPVLRPMRIEARWTGPDGPEAQRLVGLEARSFLHQLDHLDGRLFIHRLSPLKRRMLLAKHAKRRR